MCVACVRHLSTIGEHPIVCQLYVDLRVWPGNIDRLKNIVTSGDVNLAFQLKELSLLLSVHNTLSQARHGSRHAHRLKSENQPQSRRLYPACILVPGMHGMGHSDSLYTLPCAALELHMLNIEVLLAHTISG